MDRATVKALRGSIKKWELIVLGRGTDEGDDNCPLCHMFFDNDCIGCPVSARTGHSNCVGSPYAKFVSAVYADFNSLVDGYEEGGVNAVIGPRSMQAAIDEYNFLVSLLP